MSTRIRRAVFRHNVISYFALRTTEDQSSNSNAICCKAQCQTSAEVFVADVVGLRSNPDLVSRTVGIIMLISRGGKILWISWSYSIPDEGKALLTKRMCVHCALLTACSRCEFSSQHRVL
jgi:hypothetical protein